MIQGRGNLTGYNGNSSIDTLTESYTKLQPNGYQSRSAVKESYWNAGYVGGLAALGGIFGLILGGGIGGVIGIIVGGAAGACVDSSTYTLSKERFSSLRQANPRWAELYEQAAEYGREAMAKGCKTRESVENYIKAKFSGLSDRELEQLVEECGDVSGKGHNHTSAQYSVGKCKSKSSADEKTADYETDDQMAAAMEDADPGDTTHDHPDGNSDNAQETVEGRESG